MMKFDISYLLESWDYHPGQLAVRKFTGTDGVEKLQMRLDLGILQMNTDGRPDGKLPMGFASWFEFHEDRLEKHKQENEGQEEGFELAGPDITRLQQEAIQFHHRYICFYQLGEYDKVARDAERNLKVFDFVDDYAASDELSWSLQQFRPQLIMMLTRAEGSLGIEAGDLVQAMEVIREGIDALKEFYLDFERQDLLDNSGEIHSLEQWLEEIEANPTDEDGESDSDMLQPLTKLERLERDLNKAVELENYEKAAKIRDQINNLKSS